MAVCAIARAGAPASSSPTIDAPITIDAANERLDIA
jgi:hypothetical protein